MKKVIFCLFIVSMFASCGQKLTVFESGTPEEKWDIMREYYIVPSAPVSNERPLPNVLSEKEVLLKAADAAIKEGVLDPSYYEYENNPALLNAKIETPILLFDASTGLPDSYFLTAVDENGTSLAIVTVSPTYNVDEAAFVLGRIIVRHNGPVNHVITKREAADLIQEQFSENMVSEPIAIHNLRVGDNEQSHRGLFWYFEVSDNTRSVAGTGDGYIIGSTIPGYKFIPGGVSNRAAIDFVGGRGDHYLKGYRMAKLDKNLRIFDKFNAARTVGNVTFPPLVYPADPPVGFTPVPLK
jgi:hypothetical protein